MWDNLAERRAQAIWWQAEAGEKVVQIEILYGKGS